jgi:outer membrane protein assembly factor BamB
VSSTIGHDRYFYYDNTVEKLYALNAQTGAQLWERGNLETQLSGGVGPLIYANRVIYCSVGESMSGNHGYLGMINGSDGIQVNRPMYGSDRIGLPTIRINDTVYYSADHPNFK